MGLYSIYCCSKICFLDATLFYNHSPEYMYTNRATSLFSKFSILLNGWAIIWLAIFTTDGYSSYLQFSVTNNVTSEYSCGYILAYLHEYFSKRDTQKQTWGSKSLHTSQCDTFCHTLVCKNNWNLMNSSEIIHQYTFQIKPRKRLLNFTPKMLLTNITSPLQLCLFGRRLILERLHLKDFYIFTEA